MNEEQAGVDVTQAEAIAIPQPSTVGQLLAAARVAKGYSLNDVALGTKFHLLKIKALEADDMASLGERAYQRGLVRSYARFLKLDEQPLLALLGPANIEPVSLVEPPSMGVGMPSSGGPSLKKTLLVLAGLVILLIALAAAWTSFSRYELAASDASQAEPMVPASAPVPAVSPAIAVSAPAISMVPMVSAPALTATAPAPVVSAPAVRVTAAAVAVERGITVSFSGPSWVRVMDANKSELLHGIFNEGERKTVSGKAPYTIDVGRISVVKMTYAGQSVDLKTKAKGEVAHLVLE